jgi:VIT1/CCC1 family predicted Fe2+/Mn2+ transporter
MGMTARAGSRHPEQHLAYRAGWLRAAVLGANDGLVSIASLVLGVAAAGSSRAAVVTAGVAGLAAGALSMAAGEYVSVSSQRDVELADLARERREHAEDPEGELAELAGIYRARGLSADLAQRVAEELSNGDRLAAHARDELGFDEAYRARPVQALLASALAFGVGAALPLIAVASAPSALRIGLTLAVTLVALALLGVLGARLGGAPTARAAVRVLAGGALAMAATMGIGLLVGTSI